LKKVAIVDFDVHHGNGTEDIFKDDERVMLCSTFQHPFYPYSGADTSNPHIVNVPLPAGTTGKKYREVFEVEVMPKLEAFQPEMIFFSAGFDAHREDDMGQFGLMESDYIWVTEQVMAVAARHAQGRIVSLLEGGYDLSSLGRSVAAHIKVLADLYAIYVIPRLAVALVLHQSVNVSFKAGEFFVEIAGELQIADDGFVESFARNQQRNAGRVGCQQDRGDAAFKVVDLDPFDVAVGHAREGVGRAHRRDHFRQVHLGGQAGNVVGLVDLVNFRAQFFQANAFVEWMRRDKVGHQSP
jgi:hypothetical protein